METAIFIPARLDSKRLPRKMLRQIGEQTLVAHTIDRAKESGIKNIFLATDSEEIINAAANKDIQTILTSLKHQSGSDRIYEALTKVDPDEKKFSHIINLQSDLPFINPKMITDLKIKSENSTADIITLVSPITNEEKINSPGCVKVAINFYDDSCLSGKALYFSRQAIPHQAPTYYEHIGIYAYKRAALKKFIQNKQSSLEKQESLEQLRAYNLDMNIEVHLVHSAPISIDTLYDLEEIRSEYFCATQ
jgi:3-deoxy-manno-octulosonate cytidylyltransferase (CMP-KDO synthetase)